MRQQGRARLAVVLLLAVALATLPCPSALPTYQKKVGTKKGEDGGVTHPPKECEKGMSAEAREKRAKRHLQYSAGLSGNVAIRHLAYAVACSKDGRGVGEASYQRALLLDAAGRRQEAAVDMDMACKHLPAEDQYGASACMTLGIWRSGVGDAASAQQAFSLAISRNVLDDRAWTNYGIMNHQMGLFQEALKIYKVSAAINPRAGQIFFNIGKVYQDIGRVRSAVGAFRRAVSVDPNYFEAYASLGGALTPMRMWKQASEILSAALELQPHSAEGLYLLAFALMHICEWGQLQMTMESLLASVLDRLASDLTPGVEPYAALTFPWDPKLLRSIAEHHAAYAASTVRLAVPLKQPKLPRSRQLLVGIKSFDIGDHQSSYLAIEVMGTLAASPSIRLSVYCLRPNDGSELRAGIERRVRDNGGTFRDVSLQPTGEIAVAINGDGVHVLVDMDAHFRNSRMEVMALKSAPVQMHYPFFVGTAGAAFLPLSFNDAVTTPPELAPFFSERLVYLPYTYYVNSHKLAWEARPPERAGREERGKQGLPKEGIILANFNQFYKIDSPTFAVWMRVLLGAPGSVLWLRSESEDAHAALKAYANKSGVDPQRIVFAKWARTTVDHLKRSTLGSLSLDTPLYSSMTTACDILWAGVPLITAPGVKMVSRLAASLLTAMGMEQLVARDMQEYAIMASSLARMASENHRGYAQVKDAVLSSRQTSALFDMKLRAEGLVAGFRLSWELFTARAGEGKEAANWAKNLIVK